MYKFEFADVGEGIHEAVLCEWHVKEGDEVKEGQELYSVETDKFTTEIPSPVSGVVKKIYFEEGSDIVVGDLVIDIDDGSGGDSLSSEVEVSEETPKEETAKEGASVIGSIKVSDDIIESYHVESEKPEKTNKKVLATPVARNLAKILEIDITEVQGTGPQGRVTKKDIQDFSDRAKKPETSTTETKVELHEVKLDSKAKVERVKMSKMRETISKNMEKSKFTIPHTTSMYDVDVTELWELRKEVNASLANEGVKLSFMPFIIKALVSALKKHPVLNSELDAVNREIVIKHYYNIGIAVDTTAGLAVPIIKDADTKSILEIHHELVDLAQKAENRELGLDSMTGGSFTITNYGSLGAIYGTPVINFPEAAILGIGAITKRPIFNENDEVVPAYILPVSISFDHRIIDGGEASRFAMTLSKILSSKSQLILN